MLDCIRFRKLDFPKPDLEPTAVQIAEFILTHPGHFEEFCEWLRFSTSWRKHNYQTPLAYWKKLKIGRAKKLAADTQLFLALVDKFFSVCRHDEDIKAMRGLVAENLLYKVFIKRYEGQICKLDTGCSVIVDGLEVIYVCPAPLYDDVNHDADINKKTVDIGSWDGVYGEFGEIKVSPDSFQTKDIKYLRLLAQTLFDKALSHKVYLIALQNKELTQHRLRALSCFMEDEFTFIGREDILGLQRFVI